MAKRVLCEERSRRNERIFEMIGKKEVRKRRTDRAVKSHG